MAKVRPPVAITLLAMCCLAMRQGNAGDIVAEHPGILMPNVNLLGPSSAARAGSLRTTVIATKETRTGAPAVSVSAGQASSLASSSAEANLKPKYKSISPSEATSTGVINKRFFAHTSKTPTPDPSNKRYNGYMKSQAQVNVWLDDALIRLSGNMPVTKAAGLDHPVLRNNGRLEFTDKKLEIQSFIPGQFIPRCLLTLQFHKSLPLKN